jgi:hypothetical protein
MDGVIFGICIGGGLGLLVLAIWLTTLSDAVKELQSEVEGIKKELGIDSCLFYLSRLDRLEREINNLPHNKAKRAQELINEAEHILKDIEE